MTTEIPADNPRDIRLQRDVSAPRELVWAALTNPVHLARWWGPTGFRTETHAHDFRPGGTWHLTMHGPDGRAYVNYAVFDTIVAPERVVLRYVEKPGSEPAVHVTTITLEALDAARTRVTLTAHFPSAEVRQDTVDRYGAVEGGKQTLGRLAALLEGGGVEDRAFVVRRVLRAPPALVWAVWTDATHLAKWFHPTVWTITRCALDLRVGGSFSYSFAGPDFPEAHGLWRITEVQAPRRLGFDIGFADAAGNPAPSPFGGPWPARVGTTVTFEHHAGIGGGTILTLRQAPRDATEDEAAAFFAMAAGMEQGWGQTFESLAAYVDAAG